MDQFQGRGSKVKVTVARKQYRATPKILAKIAGAWSEYLLQ